MVSTISKFKNVMNRETLFSALINLLENNHIKYAIVGRTEDYPTKIGSDIDIIISQNKIHKFKSVIWELESEQTKIVQLFQHECVAFYYVVYDITEKNIIYIQPDVCTNYYRKGRKLLDADYLLNNIQEAPQRDFKILSPEKEFIYYLLKKIDKQNISQEQFLHISNCFVKKPVACLSELPHFWQDKNLQIIETAFKTNQLSFLTSNLYELQKSIHAHKKMSLRNKLENTILKIKRIYQPTGLVIGVLGPDGSGKTTIINQFKQDIASAFRRIRLYHLFPKPKDHESINTNPQGLRQRGFILSLLKLLYFVLIYNWGFLKIVWPSKIRSTLIIFDRYYDDILIDPIRYRNGTPKWIVRLVGFFIPRPQLWIVLDAPTDIIQKRKSEVTPEETERQRQQYIHFAQNHKNSLLIDTDREVKQISLDICKFICNKLNERAIKRYKP